VQQDALSKVKQFADTAYFAAVETATRELQEKSGTMRNQLAARGALQSGLMAHESAKLYGAHIKALLQIRLDALIEGYELHGIPIDDALSTTIIDDVTRLRSSLLTHTEAAVRASPIDRGPVELGYFVRLVEQQIDSSVNSIKIQIDRKRLMKKTEPTQSTVTNVYHVHGHNPRWNVNSTDHSVNVVTASNDQIFQELRQQITSGLPASEERKDILDKLTALEDAQASPGFAQRYAEFISVAANHMQILAPFVPALTEMLSKVIS